MEPETLARLLRSLVGLAPDEPAPGEQAATLRRPMPAVIRGVDAGGWIAWCLVGPVVFGEPAPVMRRVRAESKRIVAALAMLHAAGSLSAAARELEMSRKVLRDHLRDAGLYPWPGAGPAQQHPTS